MVKIILLALFLLNSSNFHGSVHINCKYGMYSFWAVGNKYECKAQNDPIIDSPDKVNIDDVTGTHTAGKTNNNEIYFHAESKVIQFFPQGIDKIFPNLIGIQLFDTKLKSIQKSDLKSYKNLTYLNLNTHNIKVLENDLFEFNPNIEYVLLQNCNIVHIGLNVFDNLNKLKSLYIGWNPCTGDYLNNTGNNVKEVIKRSKIECKDPDFDILNAVFYEIFNQTKTLDFRNFASFRRNVIIYGLVFNNSNYANYWPLKEKVQKLNKFNILDYLPETFAPSRTTNEPKIIPLTTPKTVPKKSPNWTRNCSNCCRLGELKTKNQENFKYMHNLVNDFKVSVTDFLVKIDQKIDNVLSLVDAKILNLEEHLSAKIKKILEDKLDEILKNVKND